MTQENDTETMLLNAIASADANRVRKVLSDVCKANAAAFDLACNELLTRHVGKQTRRTAAAGTKRKGTFTQQRYEFCVQCKKEYDIEQNAKRACQWHPGTRACT